MAAQDQADNWTPYSPARTFSVNILYYPTNNLTTTGTKPTFRWFAVPGTNVRYHLQVADSSDFSNILVDVTDLSTTRYTLPDPISNPDGGYGAFFWRVQVSMDGGSYLPANPPARILRISPTAPPAPLSTAPKSGTTLSLTTPTFTWNAVPVTTAGGPFSYELQGDTSPAFTSPLDFSMAPTQDQLSFTPGSPLAVGRYYWRVRAINKFGVPGRWSALRVVTIRTMLPACCCLLTIWCSPAPVRTLYWYAFSTAKNYHVILRQDNTCDTADPALRSSTSRSATTYLRLLADLGATRSPASGRLALVCGRSGSG